MLFFLLMLSCLPLVVGIRAQEHLGVGLINLKLPGFLACLGKRRIIELLLHKQIRIQSGLYGARGMGQATGGKSARQ